ncbi:unnamed protein product [Sphagnum compactum]
MHMLRMIGRNCVERGGRSMQFCVKRAGFVFSRVLFRNRFVNFNLEGRGTSMQFCAKRGGFVFLCVLFRNRFVDGNLEDKDARQASAKLYTMQIALADELVSIPVCDIAIQDQRVKKVSEVQL